MVKLEDIKVADIRKLIKKYNDHLKISGYSSEPKKKLISMLRNHKAINLIENEKGIKIVVKSEEINSESKKAPMPKKAPVKKEPVKKKINLNEVLKKLKFQDTIKIIQKKYPSLKNNFFGSKLLNKSYDAREFIIKYNEWANLIRRVQNKKTNFEKLKKAGLGLIESGYNFSEFEDLNKKSYEEFLKAWNDFVKIENENFDKIKKELDLNEKDKFYFDLIPVYKLDPVFEKLPTFENILKGQNNFLPTPESYEKTSGRQKTIFNKNQLLKKKRESSGKYNLEKDLQEIKDIIKKKEKQKEEGIVKVRRR